ncbi:hypothetical protein ACFYZE_01640 [Streptomyces sp. NPDC001796]|uniref:hypothetical protein n=1 Tax=Streptomyces sp. NPDC001796 TaxID=3364609 RepID=UPI0036B536C6
MSGNSFHGPTSFQVGDHNTLNVSHYTTTATPSPLEATADELARVVLAQWQKEAGLRRLLAPATLPVRWQVTDRKVAGRLAGATAEGGRARFTPLPGLKPVARDGLLAGGGLLELHAVYGGLASGRLLLIGPPAAGKTATAVLLLLDALEYRALAAPQDRARIPVPVLLSLEGWDPSLESAVEWAAGRLSHEYTLFRGRGGRGRARRLLEEGALALFLDGLDEVSGKVRAAMVSALEPAPCRLVLISRAREAVLTARKARLGGAVALELQPVRPEDAAAYLLDPLPSPPPSAWRAVTRHIVAEPDSAVARALSNPLAIGLLRDVYPDDGPVDELLDETRFPSPRAVEDHLLDHAVIAAYTPRPGHPRPRHSPETAERTLRYLATRLSEDGTRELCWWHIPAWVDPRGRGLFVGTVIGVVQGVLAAYSMRPYYGPVGTVLFGVFMALLVGAGAVRLHAGAGSRGPLPSAGWRDIFTVRGVGFGASIWLGAEAVFHHVPELLGASLPQWQCIVMALPFGFSATLVSGRGYELVKGTVLAIGTGSDMDSVREELSAPPVAESRSVGPRDVWRHHLGLRLMLSVLVSINVLGLITPCFVRLYGWRTAAAVVGAGAAFTALASGLLRNLAVTTALTVVQLSIRESTPLRLLSFLEDARRRNLLRATGPVYQFRHSRLQERLARRG